MANPSVKSALRAMELLAFFSEWRRPASVKEVSQTLGYPQSSTSVLLRTLADAGYFDHDARTGMYIPGMRLLLATEWIGEQMLSERSLLRLMQQVHAQTGHTVMIGAQQGLHVCYLHVLQATRAEHFTAKIGSLRPLFRSATGKMLLTLKPDWLPGGAGGVAGAMLPSPTLLQVARPAGPAHRCRPRPPGWPAPKARCSFTTGATTPAPKRSRNSRSNTGSR